MAWHAEEQLYLLLAKPDIGKNYGKAYKLEAVRFQSSTQRTQAFEADAIDLASSGAVGVLFTAAEGVTGKVIASLARESPRGFATSYYVRADSPIQAVADAKGKIVRDQWLFHGWPALAQNRAATARPLRLRRDDHTGAIPGDGRGFESRQSGCR